MTASENSVGCVFDSRVQQVEFIALRESQFAGDKEHGGSASGVSPLYWYFDNYFPTFSIHQYGIDNIDTERAVNNVWNEMVALGKQRDHLLWGECICH
jgi:hypothetical protein